MKTEVLVKHTEKDHRFVRADVEDLIESLVAEQLEQKALDKDIAYLKKSIETGKPVPAMAVINDCKTLVIQHIATSMLTIVIGEMGKKIKFFNIGRIFSIGKAVIKLVEEAIEINKQCKLSNQQ